MVAIFIALLIISAFLFNPLAAIGLILILVFALPIFFGVSSAVDNIVSPKDRIIIIREDEDE